MEEFDDMVIFEQVLQLLMFFASQHHIPYQAPSNYLIPHPGPSKPYYDKEYSFSGPPLPSFQRPEPSPSSTPNDTTSSPNRDNRCEYEWVGKIALMRR